MQNIEKGKKNDTHPYQTYLSEVLVYVISVSFVVFSFRDKSETDIKCLITLDFTQTFLATKYGFNVIRLATRQRQLKGTERLF